MNITRSYRPPPKLLPVTVLKLFHQTCGLQSNSGWLFGWYSYLPILPISWNCLHFRILYTKSAKKMGKYQKELPSRFPRLKRQLQHQFKSFFSSRSKFLSDIPAAASESERTRRSAALSSEMSPNEDDISQNRDGKHLDRFAIGHESTLGADLT